MVANGYEKTSQGFQQIKNVEILDDCGNHVCNIVDYPMTVSGSMPLKCEGIPVICGGYAAPYGGQTKECHYFDGDQWQLAYHMSQSLKGQIVVEYKPAHYFLMGGMNFYGNVLKKVSWFNNGNFEANALPDLPEPIYYGSGTLFNYNKIFVAASVNSAKNYVYDLMSQAWSELPQRNLAPTDGHASGTFYNTTAGEDQVAVIAIANNLVVVIVGVVGTQFLVPLVVVLRNLG